MFVDFLRSLFRLRKTNVSILVLLTYLTIGLIYFYDHEHYKHVSPEQSGFQDASQLVEDAWLDLQNITFTYHPYFSRDNERVHDYLLHRIESISRNFSYVSISDDASNNKSVLLRNSFVEGGAVYFESSNIVVKIEGKNTDLPGLLLSAHYDGVPTSHGATDDGKGVVSLLGILDHYSRHRPERTVVFNFNNNEEFGLLGARAFMNHPWSELVSYVINLEGTGIGGKAILFRTSDTSTARIYQKAVKSNPFGTSIFQQGFYERRVNSETDYRIYEENGLRGFDIAFYKPRDFYHTTRDSVQYTSREALWHMFHTAWQLTEYIVKEPVDNEEDFTPAVFFDVAGLFFFVTSSKTLFKWCCVILVLLPVIAFHFDVISFSQNRSTNNRRHYWKLSIRLPLSLVVSCLLLKLTEKLLRSHNTFILSRGHLLPLLALATEFLLCNYFILSFFEYFFPTRDFKTTALRQVAILNWIVLFVSTIMLYRFEYKYTGIYAIVVLYSLISLAATVGLFGRVLKGNVAREPGNNEDNSSHLYGSYATDEEEQVSERSIEGEPVRTLDDDDNNSNSNNEAPIDNSTANSEHIVAERTPLLGSHPPGVAGRPGVASTLKTKAVSVLTFDWTLQFLIAVPVTTFIVFGGVNLSLDALRQTIQEGSSATKYVWNLASLGAIALTLPVLPFAYKFNCITATLFLVISATALNLSFLQSPFTEWAPLKLKFSQEININNGSDAIVNVYGRKGGFLQPMLQDLPSVKQSGRIVWCQDEINGMERCFYTGYQPNPFDSQRPISIDDIFSLKVISNDKNDGDRSPYAPINAQLEIDVKENRGCTLSFKSQHLSRPPVRQFIIHHSDNTSDLIKSTEGFTQLQLHKLDFDQQYHIGVQWLPKILLTDGQEDEDNDELDLQVTCYWGEYDSESLVNGQHLRKLPAFDELLQYSPLNVSYANRDKGLLTITQEIEL